MQLLFEIIMEFQWNLPYMQTKRNGKNVLSEYILYVNSRLRL